MPVRYEVLALVGEGGFGKVYRARMMGADQFQKDVAVKILTDDHPARSLLQRFRDEARILGRLRDRAIVGAQNPIRLGGCWSVIMDYVDGESLGGLVTRAAVPPGVAVEVIGEVARALDSAWRQEGADGQPLELIHRDIKPDNIQITPSGEVKLLDFGIAKATFAEREAKTKQAFAGTPGYIAPERTQGIELPVGDVYSLGVCLHEIVTGTRPRMPATVILEAGQPIVSREDLEVEDPDSLAPDLRAVLELAAWMRAYEHDDRPSARLVEERCRGLRQRATGPWLRDWAEASVRSRVELPPDERVGRTYLEEEEGGPTQARDGSLPPTPIVAALPENGSGRTALAGAAAVFGASGLVLLVALGLAVVALGSVGWAFWSVRQGPPDAPIDGGDVPVVDAPVPQIGVDPAPDAQPGARPDPVAPGPVAVRPGPIDPPRPKERVIDTTGGGSPAPEPGGTAPGPVPGGSAPTAGTRTGQLLLTTVPSRPKVRLHGEVVPGGAGNAWSLPIGTQSVVVESTTGERYTFLADIREDRALRVCYDFDTDSRCDGG